MSNILLKKAEITAGEIASNVLKGGLRGMGASELSGYVAGLDTGKGAGKSVGYKGIIPGVSGQIASLLADEYLPEEHKHLANIPGYAGDIIAAIRGFREKRKAIKEARLEEDIARLRKESSASLVKAALLKKLRTGTYYRGYP